MLGRTCLLTVAVAIHVTLAGCALESEGSAPGDASIGDGLNDFAVPTDAIWPCGPDEKRCDGVCVGMQSDPENFGCDKLDCSPCPFSTNTVITCSNFACVTGDCMEGAGDCDANIPGCETSLRSVENCGECGTICAVGSGVGDCSTGICQVVNCETGWGDCDGDPQTGCETNLRTVTDCEECGTPCSVEAPDVPSCAKGYCDKVCDPADPLREDCDGDPSNGCETSLDTLENCGGCGNKCSRAHAETVCDNGVCKIDECDTGWGDCDSVDHNGCETNVQSSANNCGDCGDACESNNTTNRTCTDGQCRPTCVNAYGDCNGPDPGDSDDGCEESLDTPTHCGGCGTACSPDHATGICPGGFCQISSCQGSWENCDNNHGNGCEVDLDGNSLHCGACDRACSTANISPSCSEGVCDGDCAHGWGDCNHDKLTDGCELDTSSDPSNCSGCGVVCSTNHLSNAGCSNATCTGTCDSGWGDCDGDPSNGCESDINTDVDHCGGCDQACSDNHINRHCSGGNCDGSCDSGYRDCNNSRRNDGCEAHLATDVDNCGRCGDDCSTNHVTPTCSGGSCWGTCDTGWADCNGDLDEHWGNGCERDVSSDVDNCGGCYWECSWSHVYSQACVNGRCDPVCDSGRWDCDGPEPGNVDDGCEANSSC